MFTHEMEKTKCCKIQDPYVKSHFVNYLMLKYIAKNDEIKKYIKSIDE